MSEENANVTQDGRNLEAQTSIFSHFVRDADTTSLVRDTARAYELDAIMCRLRKLMNFHFNPLEPLPSMSKPSPSIMTIKLGLLAAIILSFAHVNAQVP